MGTISFSCDCCAATYIQAKKCIDGSNVDLWILKSGLTLPYHFTKSGVCYYIEEGNAEDSSLSGHTALTGQTQIASCGASPCQCANCPDEPAGQYTVTFTGVHLCNCEPHSGAFADSGKGAKITGPINGTYCLSRTSETSCVWSATISGFQYVSQTNWQFPTNMCQDASLNSGSAVVTLTRTSGTWSLCVELAGFRLFSGSVSETNCYQSTSVSGGADTCMDSLASACGTLVGGNSGSATITPEC